MFFSDDTENLLIPVVPCSTKSRKGPAAMHLPCPTFLSKEWGEVQIDCTNGLLLLLCYLFGPILPLEQIPYSLLRERLTDVVVIQVLKVVRVLV